MKASWRSLVAQGSRFGFLLFVFLMVLREGAETVLILSAVIAGLDRALLSFLGTLAGVGVAVLFGVTFVKGSVRINLQKFFRVTTVILFFVAFQLVVSGLHELSENGVLPSSAKRWPSLGPIVRNDLFFFITIRGAGGIDGVVRDTSAGSRLPCPIHRRRGARRCGARAGSGCG